MEVFINGQRGYCHDMEGIWDGIGPKTWAVRMDDHSVYFADEVEMGLANPPLVVEGLGYEWTIPSEKIDRMLLAEIKYMYNNKTSFIKIRRFFKQNGIVCTSEGGQRQIHYYHLRSALNNMWDKLEEKL